jgi:hypothetical protein
LFLASVVEDERQDREKIFLVVHCVLDPVVRD